MKMLRLFFAVPCFVMFVAASTSVRADDVAAVIAKARAALGSEAALTRVESVHYIGFIETVPSASAADKKALRLAVDVIFKAPYRQRMTITDDAKVQITGLDGYSGWLRQEERKDASRWQVTLLPADQVRRMRANIWENLAFYRGLDRIGGSVEDVGTVQLDGKACRKLLFKHDANIVFTRYFDSATGRLQLTETDDGNSIREEGEMIVDGLRFPKKVITTAKSKDGLSATATITFDKIVINETMPDSVFVAPLLK